MQHGNYNSFNLDSSNPRSTFCISLAIGRDIFKEVSSKSLFRMVFGCVGLLVFRGRVVICFSLPIWLEQSPKIGDEENQEEEAAHDFEEPVELLC